MSPPIEDIASETSKFNIRTSSADNEQSDIFIKGKCSKNLKSVEIQSL